VFVERVVRWEWVVEASSERGGAETIEVLAGEAQQVLLGRFRGCVNVQEVVASSDNILILRFPGR